MKKITTQEHMDLLAEVNEMARDTLEEWMRKWRADTGSVAGWPLRARWQDDGTAYIEMDGETVMRVQIEITTSAVEWTA